MKASKEMAAQYLGYGCPKIAVLFGLKTNTKHDLTDGWGRL